MSGREQRGLEIAARCRISQSRGAWLVPSQSSVGHQYVVRMDGAAPRCSCPDHELHRGRCKHIFAVQFVIERTRNADGSTTVTETVQVTETIKRTYPQQWPAYNAAQVAEKDRFQILLRALCGGTGEPPQDRGRPRLPLADVVFSAAFKVYSTVSGRRFMSDLREAHRRGFLTR